jgi:hypothetical protein
LLFGLIKGFEAALRKRSGGAFLAAGFERRENAAV